MSTEIEKPSTKVSKSVSKQEKLASEFLVQTQPKLKFGRPKFEKIDPARSNEDPTTEIQSEWLNQKY